MDRFSIRRQQTGNGAWNVALTGELDLRAAPALKRALLELVADGAHEVVADLSGATLFDSTTLGVLLAVTKRLHAADARLAVVCSEGLHAFVVRTGLDRVLDVATRRDEIESPLAVVAR